MAPITSWLVVPDLVQKFLSFPVNKLDRTRVLELSWEEAANINEGSFLSNGFAETYDSDECIYLFNSTKVENGFRTLISNVRIDRDVFSMSEDFFQATNRDIPISTAKGLSSRFPFITPPGLVYDREGEVWGHLVDGGYIENMGATTMFELYNYLRKLSNEKGYLVDFNLIFIKNTKVEYTSEITGLHEVLSPLNTFNKVWVNSGHYDEYNASLKNLFENDRAVFVNLDRPDDKIIPLGWYLSKQATDEMQAQLGTQTQNFKSDLDTLIPNSSLHRMALAENK